MKRASIPGLPPVSGLRALLTRVRPRLRAERTLVFGGFGALAAEIALRLLEPWPLKFIIDDVLGAGTAGGGTLTADHSILVTVAVAALATVAILSLRALAVYLGTIAFALVGNRVVSHLRAELYAHLLRLPLAYHARARTGELLTRVVGDIGLLKDVTVTALLPLIASVLILASMTVVMFVLQWRLALVAVIVVPLFWLATVRMGRRIRDAARKQRRREGNMAAAITETIHGMRTVQMLSLERIFGAVFLEQNARDLRDGVKARRLSAGLERAVDVLIAIATAAVLAWGTLLVLRQLITAGELLVFLSYLKTAFKPAQDFAKYAARVAKGSAAAERVVAVLDTEPDIRDRPGAVVAPRFAGAIRLEGVSFGYDPAHPVLEDIDLQIAPGALVAIVGESGCGKSTLLSLIAHLYAPTRGCVRIDGHDVRDLTLASLRAQISAVPQETMLFVGSVRENIACTAPGASAERVEAAARAARAHEFVARMPHGYDTILGERGATLSAGQRQRLSIARAAMRDAPLFLLDEPTAGLDEENERLVVAAIQRLAVGRTTLLVTHDLRFASRTDLVVYLHGGRIAECGAPQDLLRAGGRYATLYRLQTADATGDRFDEAFHAVAS